MYFGAQEEVPEVEPFTGINVNNVFRYSGDGELAKVSFFFFFVLLRSIFFFRAFFFFLHFVFSFPPGPFLLLYFFCLFSLCSFFVETFLLATVPSIYMIHAFGEYTCLRVSACVLAIGACMYQRASSFVVVVVVILCFFFFSFFFSFSVSYFLSCRSQEQRGELRNELGRGH